MNSYNYKIINNVFFCKIERSNLSNHRKNITSIVENLPFDFLIPALQAYHFYKK